MSLPMLQASSNPVIPPPVQSLFDHILELDPHFHVLQTIPFGPRQMRSARLRLEAYNRNPNAKCRMQKRLEHLQFKHSYRAAQQRHVSRRDRPISIHWPCVVYAIYSRGKGDRVYIGITYRSAWRRNQTHYNHARVYRRLPPEARNHYNSTHALYRTWGQHGLKDGGLIVLETLGRPSDYRDAADFHAQKDHVEASWINIMIAKSSSPRGFNGRGISHNKRRRTRATALRKRLHRLHTSGRLHTTPLASGDDSSQDGSVAMPASSEYSSNDDDTAPPPPPLSPHANMLTEVENESGASLDAPTEVPDSASHTAYARRAFVHLMNLRHRQTSATWDTTTGQLVEDVFGENAILQYLKPFRLRLLHKLHFVLRSFTIEHLNQCRPNGAQTAWCFDDVQFMGYLFFFFFFFF